MASRGYRLMSWGMYGFVFAVLLTSVGAVRSGAQRTPTFRTGVEQIEVSVIARDRDGNFVSDLKLEDFELLEDGRKQDINDFVLVDLPVVTAAPSARVSPVDVATNAQPADGRIYVLVLDDLQVETDKTHHVRTAAREFVTQHMGPSDIAAIVTTAGFGASSNEFTQDRLKLLQIIDLFIGQKDGREPASGSNLQGARGGGGGAGSQGGQGMPGMMGVGGRPGMGGLGGGPAGGGGGQGGAAIDPNKRMKDMKDFMDAQKSMDVLRRIAEMLGRAPGRRKAVVYFSQGVDYDVYDVMGRDTMYASEVRTAQAEAIAAATRNNVAFYGIDPRGLAIAGFGQGDADSLRRSIESLRALSDDTGGFAHVNNNDHRTALARVAAENSRYYVLGYHPKEQRRDGRFHSITVKVRRPGISVVARPGYTAPDARRERREREKREKADRRTPNVPDPIADQLTNLLSTPIAVKGLDMRLHAAAFKGSGRKASVMVTLQFDGATLPMVDKDGKYLNKLQIALIALDSRHNVAHSIRATADLAVPSDQSIRLRAAGVRWMTRFDLEPGRYHLRLAAIEGVVGKDGSALCDVEVPDFEREDRSVSGLLLTSNAADLAYTQGWKDISTWDHLPAPPTTTRVFVEDDVLFAALELYDRKRPPRSQTVVFRIEGTDGTTVRQVANTFKAGDFKDDRYVTYLTLPLKTLSPGQYALHAEVKPEGGDDRSLKRALSFEVVKSSGNQ